MLPTVFTLWIGEGLSPVERMCLQSFVANGHPVRLYAYSDVSGVPGGVELKPAESILPWATVGQLLGPSPSRALISDLFRYFGMKREAGIWVDTDVVCLKPIADTAQMVIGWESRDYLNGAILRLPPDSPILADVLMFTAPGMFPPWATPWWKTLPLAIRDLQGELVYPPDFPRGTYGPKGLTALLRKHGLLGTASAPEIYYPLHPRRALDLFRPGLSLSDITTPNSLTIHLWNEKLGSHKHTLPPDTVMSELMERYA